MLLLLLMCSHDFFLYMLMPFFPLEALTQMSGVVEVWQAEDADFFMPSQVRELVEHKDVTHWMFVFIAAQLHSEHVYARDAVQCARMRNQSKQGFSLSII